MCRGFRVPILSYPHTLQLLAVTVTVSGAVAVPDVQRLQGPHPQLPAHPAAFSSNSDCFRCGRSTRCAEAWRSPSSATLAPCSWPWSRDRACLGASPDARGEQLHIYLQNVVKVGKTIDTVQQVSWMANVLLPFASPWLESRPCGSYRGLICTQLFWMQTVVSSIVLSKKSFCFWMRSPRSVFQAQWCIVLYAGSDYKLVRVSTVPRGY
jgi:hypothetical protein